jgi:hypothetical protein
MPRAMNLIAATIMPTHAITMTMTASTTDGRIRRFGPGGLLAASVKDWRR